MASPTSDFVKLCHNIAEFHPFMPGRKAGPTDFIAGANMGIRRSLFEEVKGFRDTDPVAPDMHFILKARQAGYQIHFVPEAVVTHDHDRTSFSSIFRYSADHASETILLRNRYRRASAVLHLSSAPRVTSRCSPGNRIKSDCGHLLQEYQQCKSLFGRPL